MALNEISGGEQSEEGLNPSILNCPTDNSSSSSQQEVETLPEAGKKGNDAGHGNRFQSKLLILYAVRAIQLKYEFYLGTELSVGEKFDDLIFHYKDENDVTFRQQYLQAKHRLNEKDFTKNITAQHLLDAGNGDFSLLKYFQSYVKIRSKGNDVEHFIICTNVHFNPKDFHSNGIKISLMKQETWPKLLDCKNVKNQQNCYKFQVHGKCKSILTGNILQCIQNCTGEEMKCLFKTCKEIINGKQFSDYTADEMNIFFSDPQNQMQFKILVEVVLNDFLEKLVFAVKMPNEDELDEILTKDVGKYFKLSNADLQSDYVMNKMVNWFKKQENLWLTSKDAEDFKKKAGELIKLSHRTSLSIDYQRQSLKLGVLKFNDEVVNQITLTLEEFLDSREKVKRIKTETPKLTAVKVISAIQKMTRYPNDDDYLVISSRKLKENINELEESKRAEKCHHLFVIVDDDAENPLENDTSYQNSIPTDLKKKVIVISKNVSPGDSADPITFGKFHEDTKNMIRNMKVLFQEIDKTVGDLIKESQENELDSKFIENLLYTENNETNSVPSFNFGFNPSLYIQRTLKFPLEDQLLNKLAGVMDNNDSEEMDRINDGSMFRSEKKNKNVKEEIRIDSNGKIHWLIDDDKRKRKIWEKLKFLLEQIDSKDWSLLNEIHSNNNRIIITGVAGTGKSTILSKYYEKIKEVNPDKLVIKISLMNYSKALMNEKSINEFLINNVMGQNAFARQLLKHRLETGDRIILMLDGFDEIDTECQDKVVQLVKNLNESIPLYITTRPHLAEKLQFELSQLAYSLDKFTEEDQINYLTSIWEKFIKLEEETNKNYNEETIKKFAKDLIKRVSETLKDKEKEFIGIPLQCKILAECFQSKIKEKIIREPNTDLSHLIGDQQFDLADLYKSMFDEKRRVFRQEKIEENSRNGLIVNNSIEYTIYKTERHLRKLAVQLIVNKQKDVNILIPSAGFQSESEKKTEEKQLNEFGIRFGLVDDKGENGIQFLHRTYAEYLVADFIFNGFLLDEEIHNKFLENVSARKWIIEEMLVNYNYEGVRVFFDSMLKGIILQEEWKSRIQNKNLPLRFQQFAALLRPEKDKIWSFIRALLEINSNISLLIFDCLDVTFQKMEISSIMRQLTRGYNDYDYYTVSFFRQRSDVFNRLFNYFDNAVNDDLSQLTERLIHDLNNEEQQIENKKLERFLVFVGRHVKHDWNFHELTVFFIRSKTEEQTRNKFFKILTSKYSEDFELTRLMKDAIKKCHVIRPNQRHKCRIGEIERALTILRDLGQIEVAGQLSRFLLFRKSETLKKEENDNIRLSLEKMGMIGLHGAAIKGDLSLIEKEIGISLQNPENCSKEKKKSVIQLMTNEKDEVPPLYLAAAYGHDDICQKIFRFLHLKKEISNGRYGFLHRSLKDAIKYENVVMLHTILKCVKEGQGQNDLVKLLQSMISNIYFILNKMQFELIISVFVQDTENGYQDINDLVFYNSKTLRILEDVECDVLEKMIAAAGGLENWIKRLIDTNLEQVFEVLIFDGFLDKLNQLNQIPKLIDILITKSTLDDNQPSEPLTSYWSDFVKNTSLFWRMRKFIEAISKCASEEDLKRLLFYRDDNDVLILSQLLIREGRSEFNEILSHLPENLRKEIEDLTEEEKPKLIDNFFSTPTFLESLDTDHQLNAIEYFLENGNEKQLAKFSQVVQVDQLISLNQWAWDKEKGINIADLLKEKLDKQTVIKYKEFIEKLDDK